MFNIGDLIVYGNSGVYTVAEYCKSPVDKNDTRTFYLLRPLYESASNIIMTPASNDRVMMRYLITKDEAYGIIDRIPYIPELIVEFERARRDKYKEALSSGDLEKYVSIIKSVHTRRETVIKCKKRLSETDTEYEKRAKFCLYSELASVFDIPFDSVETFIYQRITAEAKG